MLGLVERKVLVRHVEKTEVEGFVTRVTVFSVCQAETNPRIPLTTVRPKHSNKDIPSQELRAVLRAVQSDQLPCVGQVRDFVLQESLGEV